MWKPPSWASTRQRWYPRLRASFVNLSRKQGYHLCPVEARNENFHLAVPEL